MKHKQLVAMAAALTAMHSHIPLDDQKPKKRKPSGKDRSKIKAARKQNQRRKK